MQNVDDIIENNSVMLLLVHAGPHSALRGLRSLVSLHLAHNRVSRVFADWRLSLCLERLDLAHNRLADLTVSRELCVCCLAV